jgi:hypothetical protein
MRYLSIAMLSVLAACELLSDPNLLVTENDPVVVTLRRGEEVTIRGQAYEPLRLEFREVLEDSRCPVDVSCVWSGNGRVQLGSNWPAFELNTDLQPSTTSLGPYGIQLLTLSPDPVSTGSIPRDSYSIQLRITYSSVFLDQR